MPSPEIKSSKIDFLIGLILLVNLFFLLFPIYEGGLILNKFNEVERYIEFYNPKLILFNTLIFIVIIIIDGQPKLSYNFISLLVLIFFFYLSISINLFRNSFLSFITIPISYYAVFIVLSRYKINFKILKYIYIIFVTWSIIPLFILIIPIDLVWKLRMFSTDSENYITTFKGFAIHRNVYGFYTSLTIILLLFIEIKSILKLFLNILLFSGIILCEARTALLVSILVPAYYLIQTNKKKYLKYLLIILPFIVYGLYFYLIEYSTRGENVINNDDRNELYVNSKDLIYNNLFFGIGGPALVNNEDPIHNFLLQVTASYGIFVTFSFLLFLYMLWQGRPLHFKLLMIFILIYGFFQPYFQFNALSNMALIVFLIAMVINNHNSNELKKIFVDDVS